MVAAGLILVLIALGGGGFLAWMSLQSPFTVFIGPDGLRVGLLPITLFASGAVSVILLWLGVRLTAVGAKRRSVQRQQLRELRSEVAAKERSAPLGPSDRTPPQS